MRIDRPKDHRRAARILDRKHKGAVIRMRDLDLQTPNHERHLLHFLIKRKDPHFGGLSRERASELSDMLQTPNPLPNTPEDVAADRERRRAAMAEVNDAIDKLPSKFKHSVETLRAGKPKLSIRQAGYGISAVPAEPSIDDALLTHDYMKDKGERSIRLDRESEEAKRDYARRKERGPRYGEFASLSKKGYEELGQESERLRREEEEKERQQEGPGWSDLDQEELMKEMERAIEEADNL